MLLWIFGYVGALAELARARKGCSMQGCCFLSGQLEMLVLFGELPISSERRFPASRGSSREEWVGDILRIPGLVKAVANLY